MANFLSLTLSANVRQFNADIKSARKQAEDAFGAIRQTAQEAGQGAAIAFGGLAAGGVALTSSFLKAAATMQDYKATLEAMYGSADIASEKLAYFVKVASTTPFELGEIVQAGIRIKGLGQEVEKVLPKAINLAAGLKKDLGETVLTVAKAIGKSRDALLQLRDTYAITTDQLVKYGAVVNKQNEIQNEGVEEAERLKTALFGVIDAKFGDIVSKQADNLSVAFSGLKDAAFQLSAGLGEQIAPSALKVSRVITELLNGFNNLDSGTKNIIATSVVVGTAMLGAAAGIAGLVAGAALLTTAFGALAVPFGLTAAGAAAAVLPMAGLAVALTGLAAASVSLVTAAPALEEFIKQTAVGSFVLDAFVNSVKALKDLGDIKIPKLKNSADDTEVSVKQLAERLGKLGLAFDPILGKIFPTIEAFKNLKSASTFGNAGGVDSKTLKDQNDLQAFYTANKNLIGQTSVELFFKGKTEADVGKLVSALQEQQLVRNKRLIEDEKRLKELKEGKISGDVSIPFNERKLAAEEEAKALAKTIEFSKARRSEAEFEIKSLQQVANQLIGTEKAKQDSLAKTRETQREAALKVSKDTKKFNQDQRDGVFASKREELDKLKELEAANYKYAAAFKSSDADLSKELLRNGENLETEKKKLKRAADKEAYDEQFKLIERNRLAGKLTFDGAADAYKALGDKFNQKGLFFVAGAQAQAYAKVEEQTVLAIKQRIDTEQIAIKVNQQLNEQRTVTAEKEIVLGKNVAENEKIVLANIKERLDLEARSIQLNAQKEVLDSDKSPEAVAQITQKAEFDLLKVRQEAANQTLALEAKIRQSKVATLKIENDLRTATKSAVDAEIDLLQRRLQGGEDVSDALRKELALRQQLDQQIIEGNRQQQLAANPEQRAVLEKRFAQERIAEDRKAKKAKKDQDAEITRADIARNQKSLDLKKAEFQAAKDLVDQQKESGVDVAEREVQLRRQALDLAIEEVKIRVANDSVDKGVDDVIQTQKIAEIEIAKLRKDAVKDIQNINKAFKDGTTELEKQRDLLKGIVDELTKLENEDAAAKKSNGGIIGGVEDFAKASKRENDIFDLRSQKRRVEGSINDSERSKKGQLLNQLENERTGRTVGGRTVNETIQDNERQAREDALRATQEAANEQQRLKGRAEAEKRLRSDGVVRSDEEINRILGINFKKPEAEKEESIRKAAKKGGIPGLEDPALSVGNGGPGTDKILMDILQAITTALNRQGITPPPAVGKPGTKPQSQISPKGNKDSKSITQFGDYGPYPT